MVGFNARQVLPTTFQPNWIANCQFWVSGILGISLNSGNVSQWNDQSGANDSNRNVKQSTSAEQPAYTANDSSYNQNPTLTFTSSAHQELDPTGSWASSYSLPCSMFVVGQSDYGAQEEFISGSANGLELLCTTTNLYGFAGGGSTVGAASTALKNTPGILGQTIAANGALSLYVNHYSTTLTTGTTGTSGTLGGATGSLTIGARNAATFSLNGKIAEAMAYSHLLSAAELKTLVTYLGAKYHITVSA